MGVMEITDEGIELREINPLFTVEASSGSNSGKAYYLKRTL
jgi:hypothetical protein